MPTLPITAAILAGGQNSRMNHRPKALMHIGQKSVIQMMTDVIAPLFDKVLLVINDDHAAYHDLGFCCITEDRYKNRGPLGGIHAALDTACTGNVFVFACDLPLLNGELIRREIAAVPFRCKALIPRHEKGIEPLHAVYSTSCMSAITDILIKNERPSIRDLFRTIKPDYWDLPWDEAFTNINTEEEFQAFRNKSLNQ